MPEQKQPKQDKKLSLHPLNFEDALKGLLATEPPSKERREKKDKPPRKRRSRNTGKTSNKK